MTPTTLSDYVHLVWETPTNALPSTSQSKSNFLINCNNLQLRKVQVDFYNMTRKEKQLLSP
jgi:hypothetical protein